MIIPIEIVIPLFLKNQGHYAMIPLQKGHLFIIPLQEISVILIPLFPFIPLYRTSEQCISRTQIGFSTWNSICYSDCDTYVYGVQNIGALHVLRVQDSRARIHSFYFPREYPRFHRLATPYEKTRLFQLQSCLFIPVHSIVSIMTNIDCKQSSVLVPRGERRIAPSFRARSSIPEGK